jgi:hypothetical protein
MTSRIVPCLPWLLAEGTLGFVDAQLWPDGGLWLLLLWTAVLLLYRAAVAQISVRSLRLVADLLFAGLCILAVFEDGWYLLPAVAGFAACDAAGLSIRLPSLPDDREGHELGTAFASTILGWVGLAAFLSGPLYASASASVSADGVVVNSSSKESLLRVALSPQSAAILATIALLFGLISVSAIVRVRTRRHSAWRALVAVVVVLVALVALGAMTVGLWLVPGVVLALVVVRLGRPAQPSAHVI